MPRVLGQSSPGFGEARRRTLVQGGSTKARHLVDSRRWLREESYRAATARVWPRTLGGRFRLDHGQRAFECKSRRGAGDTSRIQHDLCEPHRFTVTGTITAMSRLPTLTDPLSIVGPGAGNLAIAGADVNSVLQVDASTSLVLRDVTITRARLALMNFGVATVRNTVFSGNDASGEEHVRRLQRRRRLAEQYRSPPRSTGEQRRVDANARDRPGQRRHQRGERNYLCHRPPDGAGRR